MTKRASTTVRYETRTTIDRPITDVFARLADLDGYRTWMRRTGLFRRAGKTSDGPVARGTAYFDATRMGTFHGEVTEYEPPTRIGFCETLRWFGTDLMEARPRFALEADGAKTNVHHIDGIRSVASAVLGRSGTAEAPNVLVEPGRGLEPRACSLRVSCSAD
jgi:uncharacterized protein YndB with AHSA1/START domain